MQCLRRGPHRPQRAFELATELVTCSRTRKVLADIRTQNVARIAEVENCHCGACQRSASARPAQINSCAQHERPTGNPRQRRKRERVNDGAPDLASSSDSAGIWLISAVMLGATPSGHGGHRAARRCELELAEHALGRPGATHSTSWRVDGPASFDLHRVIQTTGPVRERWPSALRSAFSSPRCRPAPTNAPASHPRRGTSTCSFTRSTPSFLDRHGRTRARHGRRAPAAPHALTPGCRNVRPGAPGPLVRRPSWRERDNLGCRASLVVRCAMVAGAPGAGVPDLESATVSPTAPASRSSRRHAGKLRQV